MKRRFIIGLFFCIAAAIFLASIFSYETAREDARLIQIEAEPHMLREEGLFERAHLAQDYAAMPIDLEHSRLLSTYYDNRAFHGAPPSIPHPVEDEMVMGGDACLKCHENGGWVEHFQAYSPVVPHPEKENCRQCHVPQNTQGLFKPNNFIAAEAPAIGNSVLTGSPPTIPHQLFLRENCLSCHAGPSAPQEIRVTHPERVNCLQCHVHDVTTIEIKDQFKREGYETEK